MDFPIVELLDDQASLAWLLKHFHPVGLRCPQCQASVEHARPFRQTRRSRVPVYRCRDCQRVYNLYTGTVFEGTWLQPAQVLLLVRGVCKGEPGAMLARELGASRMTLHKYRHRLQTHAQSHQPTTPLSDPRTETDEMFQNAGEKRHNTRRSSRSAAAAGQ
jgi:transposase-like protein